MRVKIAQPSAKTVVTQLELVGLRGITKEKNMQSQKSQKLTTSYFRRLIATN